MIFKLRRKDSILFYKNQNLLPQSRNSLKLRVLTKVLELGSPNKRATTKIKHI
jgi:hypothetical protein